MSASAVLAATLGRVAKKYRTLDQWAETYALIVEAKPISFKTKINRHSSLRHILAGLGERTISSIRPHEVAGFINRIHSARPQTAKRVLIELKDCLNEAMSYGWIEKNPAATIKAPIVRVQRNRLSLDQWWAILRFSIEQMPPWVSRMCALALVTGQRRSDLVKMQFADVWDGYLHVQQEKTGARLALPLGLRLNAVGLALGDVIDDCRAYAAGSELMLRKHDGHQLGAASLSARFESARDASVAPPAKGFPASLHECRSLSERLYRAQGINTMVLLGHTTQRMTDLYNNARGSDAGEWKTLSL